MRTIDPASCLRARGLRGARSRRRPAPPGSQSSPDSCRPTPVANDIDCQSLQVLGLFRRGCCITHRGPCQRGVEMVLCPLEDSSRGPEKPYFQLRAATRTGIETDQFGQPLGAELDERFRVQCRSSRQDQLPISMPPAADSRSSTQCGVHCPALAAVVSQRGNFRHALRGSPHVSIGVEK